jgi:hypothetical protein
VGFQHGCGSSVIGVGQMAIEGGEEALRELTDERNRADDDLLGVGGCGSRLLMLK